MKKAKAEVRIPQKLQSVLWSTDVKLLDKERDKQYIIHQVLLYGTFAEIDWLFHTYPKKEILHVFVNQPTKIYPKHVFYFIKNFILPLKNQQLLEENYVTAISGQIKPRTTSSL